MSELGNGKGKHRNSADWMMNECGKVAGTWLVKEKCIKRKGRLFLGYDGTPFPLISS